VLRRESTTPVTSDGKLLSIKLQHSSAHAKSSVVISANVGPHSHGHSIQSWCHSKASFCAAFAQLVILLVGALSANQFAQTFDTVSFWDKTVAILVLEVYQLVVVNFPPFLSCHVTDRQIVAISCMQRQCRSKASPFFAQVASFLTFALSSNPFAQLFSLLSFQFGETGQSSCFSL